MSTLTTKFKISTSDSSYIPSSKEILPVRVKDIILDETHPEYLKYGGVDSIGVVKYSLIDTRIDSSEVNTLPAAFPLSNHTKVLPLINEVVLLIRGPKKDLTFEKVDYYIPTITLFNDINYIPSIDENDSTEPGPGNEFIENNNIRPLHPFNGDVILQGRNGQSIRMTGAKSSVNTFTDNSNLNKPLTIISNGHINTDTDKLYLEDINRDNSSLYLCSDHLVPLEQSRSKYLSLNEKPILANSFKGSQIILNSGRLFFNASSDDIGFSSNTLFSVTAENISLDSKDNVGIDAKKIYLGESAKKEPLEPIILGLQLDLFLQTLLTTLQDTGQALKDARTIDQKIIPSINIQGATLESISKQLLNKIDQLKSKKVYTE